MRPGPWRLLAWTVLLAAVLLAGLRVAVGPWKQMHQPRWEAFEQDFACSAALTDWFTLYWTLKDEDSTIHLGAAVKTDGWVGFGFASQDLMYPCDLILAQGVPLEVHDYWIDSRKQGHCPAGVCADTDLEGGRDDLFSTYAYVDHNAGTTVVRASRRFVTGDRWDMNVPGRSAGPTWFNIATRDGAPYLPHHRHTPSRVTTVQIDWRTCTHSRPPDLWYIHGVMMFAAWIVAAPLGVFVARFLRPHSSWWVEIHWFILGLVLAATVVAFLVGAANHGHGWHLKSTHSYVGSSVFVLAVVQVTLGKLSDAMWRESRRSTPVMPDKVHWVLGWLLVMLAQVAAATGIQFYGASVAWYYVIATLDSLFLIAFLTLSWRFNAAASAEDRDASDPLITGSDQRQSFPDDAAIPSSTVPSPSPVVF